MENSAVAIGRDYNHLEDITYLNNIPAYVAISWYGEDLLEICNNSNYLDVLLLNPIMTTHGEYSVKNYNLISLIIDFKMYSNVKLTIDCPKLMRLVINNCDNLIMSESTKPRCLELINCLGRINIPEDVNENKIYKYHCMDGGYLHTRDIKIKERYFKKP